MLSVTLLLLAQLQHKKVLSNVTDKSDFGVNAKKQKLARSSCLTTHFPVELNVALMRNPIQC